MLAIMMMKRVFFTRCFIFGIFMVFLHLLEICDSQETNCSHFGSESISAQSSCKNKRQSLGKPNFLLLYIDDLRYMLDADPYSEHAMPNLKSIIETKGINFENAACPKPVCTPSRLAFMTGRRVRQTRSVGYFDDFYQGFKTIPGILRQKGYDTYAFGKVFDSESFGNKYTKDYNKIDICGQSRRANGECSFTASVSHSKCCCDIALPVNGTRNGITSTQYSENGQCTYDINSYRKNVVFEDHETPQPYQKCSSMPMVKDEGRTRYLLYRGGKIIDFNDYGIATCGLNKVKELSDANTPFFVAIGLNRPHLMLSAPEADWAHFDSAEFDFQEDDTYWKQTYSTLLPLKMRPRSSEANAYVKQLGHSCTSGVVKTNLVARNFWGNFRQGYYASVRFVDRIVKYVVDEMEAYNKQTRENTHIIITSDHGFLLGEYNRLGKWTLTESTVRVPLTILPSKNLQKLYPAIRVGTSVKSPVDQIDVFPTLLDMAGEPEEYQPLSTYDKLPGVSLAPYFSDPNTYTRSISISTYPSFYGGGIVFSLRSKYFRYVMFSQGGIRSRYLFDYRGGSYHRMVERENVAWQQQYTQVRMWFEKLANTVRTNRDASAWTLVKNVKPFDYDWSDTRGYIGSFNDE